MTLNVISCSVPDGKNECPILFLTALTPADLKISYSKRFATKKNDTFFDLKIYHWEKASKKDITSFQRYMNDNSLLDGDDTVYDYLLDLRMNNNCPWIAI